MLSHNDFISSVEAYAGSTRLIGWQFAADGAWDRAERLFFTQSLEKDIVEIEAWLSRQKTDDIALEALVENSDGEKFFFGVRITHLAFDKKAMVLKTLVGQGLKGQPLHLTLSQIRSVLGDPKLAVDGPDFLELGVFDLWNRVKSLVVWNRSKPDDLIAVEDIGKYSPQPDPGFSSLHEAQEKPLMLEAAWRRSPETRHNFQCWISLPVSSFPVKGQYTLSEHKYRQAIAVFTKELAPT